jgi:hypothetical protein
MEKLFENFRASSNGMKQSRRTQLLQSTSLAVAASAVFFLASSSAAHADTGPTVYVGVYAQHATDKVIYYYRVTNNTQQTISAVSIGLNRTYDGSANHDTYELIELPSGWNSKFGIPTTSSNAPSGWKVTVAAPVQDAETHALTWEPINEKMPKLLPGETLTKLSIAVDKAEAAYMTGHALITFADGSEESLSVPLGRLDRSPPRFSVTLSPEKALVQQNKYVPVNVSFSIKDDYDRMPEIRLESITANEPLQEDDIRDAAIGLDDRYLKLRSSSNNPAGRIYTITYSATDASGNKSIASGTVTVISASSPTPGSPPLPQAPAEKN